MPQPDNEKSIPGYQHPKCYARALADCCEKISGEHTVSESALESIAGEENGIVWIFNCPTQKDPLKPEPRRISTMTANILCVFHNGGLNPYDTVGGKMQDAMQAIDDERSGLAITPTTWVIDGDKLERWILKAGLGRLYSGSNLPAPGKTMKGVCPPLEYLNILYRDAPFPAGLGLYWNPEGILDPVNRDETSFSIGAIPTMDQRVVVAFRAVFFGINFYLPIGHLVPSDTCLDNASYRPAALTVHSCQTRIEFVWKDGPKSGEVVQRRV